MTTVERSLAHLENVTALHELTETVLGEAVIKQFAKAGKVTSEQVKAFIMEDYNGELCKEFVKVVRKVVQN